MKTRKEIIAAILKKHLEFGLHGQRSEQTEILSYALEAMQDALLFSLAQDLAISLEKETVRS